MFVYIQVPKTDGTASFVASAMQVLTRFQCLFRIAALPPYRTRRPYADGGDNGSGEQEEKEDEGTLCLLFSV